MPPKVSVVMSVYNGERYLREAVNSILDQTFTDFEFIIVNDGSIDNTCAILESYNDSRIVLIHNQENIGLTRSLNKGLTLAQGEYVARMDADDVAIPHRFEKQVAFLEKHPEIGILGSSCWTIDTNGQGQGVYQMPTNDLQIRWTSLLANPFVHPTVMIRRDLLIQNGLKYDEAFQTTQDYELWMRVLKYTRGANLSEPLIRYRVRYGITSKHRQAQLRNHDTIALRTIQEQLPEFVITLEQVSQLRSLFVGGGEFTPVSCSQYVALASLYLDMFENFLGRHPGEPCLKALQHKEALKVAHILLHIPIKSGSARLLKRLLTMYPGLPWSSIVHLLKASSRRFRRLLNFGVRQYRHWRNH